MSFSWTICPHVRCQRAEAVGLEPTIPILRDTCFRGRALIQPDDFHSSSCGDRNRTCVVTVNPGAPGPVPARTPPQCFPVSVVGFEPTFSCARGTRISMLSHTLIRSSRMDLRFRDGPSPQKKHPAGVEPAPPPWRDGTLPLRHGCVNFLAALLKIDSQRANDFSIWNPSLTRVKKHRVGLEPTLPHYKCGVFAAKRPVHVEIGTRRT